MRPEMPYLAAGSIAMIGGIARDGGFPPDAWKSVFGTVALVVLASATSQSRIEPVVKAFGILLLIAAVYSTAPFIGARGKTAITPAAPKNGATAGSSSGSW